MPSEFSPERVRLARRIAMAADVLQVALLPLWLAPPAAATVNIVIDIAVGAVLCKVLRPHWVFAPAFVGEAIPLVDVIPLWWASVLYVTRDQVVPPDAAKLPPHATGAALPAPSPPGPRIDPPPPRAA